MFDTRCCRCAVAIHCRYFLRAPIYCSSGFKKSTRCRYRVRATTCRAGIPPPSPAVSSNSSPRMAASDVSGAGETATLGPFRLTAAARWLVKDDEPVAVGSRSLDILITLRDGHEVYPVVDACGRPSVEAHKGGLQ